MKKRVISKIGSVLIVFLLTLIVLFSCVGKDGLPGKDGVTPTIEISEDGYWIINGVKTEHKAVGTDGKDGVDGIDGTNGVTPTIFISEDGFWVINGLKTEYKAIGVDGKNGIDGTPGKDGVNGITPTIAISEDGFWVINGEKTNVKALHEDVVENPQELSFHKQNDGTYTVSCGNAKNLSHIVIPDTYKGAAVSGIEDRAFNLCQSLESIVIPDSVTIIGQGAFSSCTSLKSVTMGNSITKIKEEAFASCKSLENITLPNSVTNIGRHAFGYCTMLSEIIIPDSVTSIGELAFSNCTNLSSITIGESVTSIGNWTFDNCISLEQVYFNAISMNDFDYSNVVFERIGENKDGIQVVIGKNVKKIPAYLFYKCSSICSIEFEEGSICENIGESAFRNCSKLTGIVIPNSVTSVSSYAFCSCTKLTSLVIGAGVTSIGDSAFYGCASLSDIYYTGSKEAWETINIASYNTPITNATIHYNYIPTE